MNKYKSVSKFLSNNQLQKKSFFKKFISQVLLCIIIFLGLLILLKYDKNNSETIYKFIYESNFSFAKVNELYDKYLGDILPFQNSAKKKVTAVFNENLSYSNLSLYKDGVNLTVSEEYLVPVVEEGIVIFSGEKEDYGNTVIIQQANGINVWYGNIKNISVNLYDYVAKGEFLGIANGSNIYLVFEKSGEYLNYKEYIS